MLTIPVLVFLIILAPLAVGSVYIVTYSAAEFIVFSLLLIHIVRYYFSAVRRTSTLEIRPRDSTFRLFALVLPLLLFLIFVLFQMVPLPASLTRSLSPNTYGLYEKLGLISGSGLGGIFTSQYLPLSLSIHGTSVAFLKWAAYGSIFFVISDYKPEAPILERRGWITVLVVSIIFIGLVEAIYGLYAYVNDPRALLWFTRTYGGNSNRVAGTYVNPNHLAGLMNITIPLSVAFFVAFARLEKRGGQRVENFILELFTSGKAVMSCLLLFSITLMILALIFSGSRMGQFGFCAGVIVTAILSVIRMMRKGQKRVPLPLLLILAICISMGLIWGAWKGLDPVIERWGGADKDLMKNRAVLWETTKLLINDFPLVGTGLGTYELAYRSYQPESFGTTLYDHSHNDYLQILAETGWIGFILWLTFFLLYIVRVIIRWIRSTDPYSVAIGAGGIVAIFAILVHSFGEFNLQIPANGLLLFVTMAITWRAV